MLSGLRNLQVCPTVQVSVLHNPTGLILHFLFTHSPQTLVDEREEDGVSYKRPKIHICTVTQVSLWLCAKEIQIIEIRHDSVDTAAQII